MKAIRYSEGVVYFNLDRSGSCSRRESSLHSEIKKWYLLEGDKLGARVDDFIVDIVQGDLLIET